jgi:hypothetical protein
MAISSTTLTTTPAPVYVSTGDSVVTLMYFCNTDTETQTINVYLVPNMASASDTNIIYKNYSITSEDTFVVDKEKIILSNGDAVYANANVSAKITTTVGYVGL